jgi:hypothetical protein
MHILSLLVLLSLFSGCVKHSSITPINAFIEIPDNVISEDALILTDIDNTVLRSAIHYGSVEYLSILCNRRYG